MAGNGAARIVSRRTYRPTLEEQETTIRFDRSSPIVNVWSASKVVWRKLRKLGIAPIRETVVEGEVSGRFYEIPVDRFRWGLKRRHPGSSRPRSHQDPRLSADSATSDVPAEGR